MLHISIFYCLKKLQKIQKIKRRNCIYLNLSARDITFSLKPIRGNEYKVNEVSGAMRIMSHRENFVFRNYNGYVSAMRVESDDVLNKQGRTRVSCEIHSFVCLPYPFLTGIILFLALIILPLLQSVLIHSSFFCSYIF